MKYEKEDLYGNLFACYIFTFSTFELDYIRIFRTTHFIEF